MSEPRLPLVAILDASVALTGATTAAFRAARSLEGEANFLLILPEGHQVPLDHLPGNMTVATLPFASLRKSVGGLLAYPARVVAAARALKTLLERERVAALLVNDFYLLQGPLLRPLGWHGRIVTMVRIDTRRFGLPGRVWLAAAQRWSDRVIAVSRFIQRTANLDPGSVVYDPARISNTREDSAPRPPRFLFIGNYISGKGQDAAIRAFHRIAADFPLAELHFHGGDMGLDKNRDYRRELERLAADGAGRARIAFFGFSDDTDRLLDHALASLTLSHSESFSFTCQDASARGVPVIATRCGGPEEIVEDRVTGFLVAIDDDAAVAKRMAQLLRDPSLARQMGQAGARLVTERFGVEQWRERMTKALGLRGPSAGERAE